MVIKIGMEKIKFINELILQKNARLSSRGFKDTFKPEDLNFYRKFENKSSIKMKTHISALTLNNELIAIHWGIIYKNRFNYLLLSMKEGNLDFEKLICTPGMMVKLSKIGKVLGPKGLMPNPKLGSVTNDLKKAITDAKSGQVEIKNDKDGNIGLSIG